MQNSSPLERIRAAFSDTYTIDRELGRGGMATVYLAQDAKHERLVALKVLHPDLAASLGPDRFLREIKLAARLSPGRIKWARLSRTSFETLARRRVCFQPCVGPGQAISATTWPNQNLSKLRGKNPATHRREFFQMTLPIRSGSRGTDTAQATTNIRALPHYGP